jgi:crotonobetainyl-CoA:carnitine CoA-transferase CaiB-like acyl-CoA transferase
MSSGPNAGNTTKTPLLPITLGGNRLPIRLNPPKLGEHTKELLHEIGFSESQIDHLFSKKIIQ